MVADTAEETRQAPRFRRDLLAVLVLALLTLVFFSRVIVRREVFFHSDISSYFMPMKFLYAERLKHWNLPFWNPYILCGYPDQSEGQNGPLYPPHLIAFSLLPVETALTVLLIFHILLAGFSMYVLARTLKIGRTAAGMTAFFYMFTGFMFSHFHHPTILFPAAWTPLLLAALELALQRGSWLIGAWAGAVLGMESLVGYPPMVIYSAFAALIYVLARARRAARTFGWPTVLLIGMSTIGFGIGLWAVQAVPTLAWASYTKRAYLSPREYMLVGSLSPVHLALYIFPNYLGQAAFGTTAEPWIWEYCGYAGLLPLLLAMFSLRASRRSWAWAVIAFIGVFMALAALNPLYRLLQYVPGISGMRVPARYIFLTTLGVCVMAGLAVDSLLRRCTRGTRGLWALAPCVICAAFTILVVVPARKTGPSPHIWPQEAAWAALTIAASALIVALAYARRMGAAAFVACCSVIAAADLWSFDYFLTPSVSPDYYRQPPHTARFLKRDESWFRVASWKTDRFINPTRAAQHGWWGKRELLYLEREALWPNFPEIFRLREMRGYAAFQLANQEVLSETSLARLANPGNDPSLVGLLGVKYIVTAEKLNNPHLDLVYNSRVRIYRNDLAMPRCFFVTSAVVAPDAKTQLSFLVSKYFSPGRVVVVDRPPSVPMTAAAGPAHPEVRWTEPRPEHLIVRVRCAQPGLLVVPDTYDALWRVFVNGKEEDVLVADYALRAVALPAGSHKVQFVYDRGLFITSSRVTLFAAILLLALTARAAWRGKSAPGRGSG